MTGSEIIIGIMGMCFGFFMGLLLAGLLRCASDAEIRLSRHVRETDEHGRDYE